MNGKSFDKEIQIIDKAVGKSYEQFRSLLLILSTATPNEVYDLLIFHPKSITVDKLFMSLHPLRQ